ncbi:MAG: hypothetical protein KatS3mg031_1122 [Chitinophagales bacterium]|nr:MAG: hypothetical protein KatS3mg031_1122 [Chitinophagales bacterium]
MRWLILAIGIVIGEAGWASAQKSVRIHLHIHDAGQHVLKGKYRLKEFYSNAEEIQRALSLLVVRLQSAGFIEASIDSQQISEGTMDVYLHMGPQYQWKQLRPGNAEPALLQQAGYSPRLWRKNFSYRQAEGLMKRLLTYLENHGYPFALVSLDSVTIKDNHISASLFVDKGPLIRYDTLTVVGDARIARGFLSSYLGIRKNGLYNESAIRKADKRVGELPFVQSEKPMRVQFQEDKARLYFYLKKKKASRFDFLLGILPNNERTGRVLITGEVMMDLTSPFGRGEQLWINWKRLQTATQTLDASFRYPYLFSTPLGIDASFHLFKRDTLYLDLDWSLGFQYLFAGGSYLKAFVQNKFTNLITVDTGYVILNRRLPPVNDVSRVLFGVEYFFENLDYRLNPKRGISLMLQAGAGTRNIKRIAQIENLKDPLNTDKTFAVLYDSTDLKTIHLSFHYHFARYWQIGRRSTVKTAVKGAAVVSPRLFENELLRLGGSRLLRGFDEESIYASLYNVVTVEYRFLLSRNAHVHIFFDGAYVENRSGDYFNDFPFGFGAGMTFDTRAGVFGVSYALGRQQGNPIDFKASKIHIGYVNYF